jgi:acyl homoserine lactone synthase
MTSIAIGRAGEPGLHATLLDSMYRLRCNVFHQRLGWDVQVENGREHDWFDLIGPHYLIAHDQAANALGCCRLLPTLGPNMLRDIFPGLVDDALPPASARTWEISRFAVDARCASQAFGFGNVAEMLIAGALRLADAHGIEEIVGVTSAPFERMLHHLGLQVERLGAPRRIGRVLSLAFRMPVSDGMQIVGAAPGREVARAA